MKVLLILAAVVAVAIGETCPTPGDGSDCTITTCSNGGTVTCSTQNVCVCPAPGGTQGASCMDQTTCDGMDCSHHHGDPHEGHCVDGYCQCIVLSGSGNHHTGQGGHHGNHHP